MSTLAAFGVVEDVAAANQAVIPGPGGAGGLEVGVVVPVHGAVVKAFKSMSKDSSVAVELGNGVRGFVGVHGAAMEADHPMHRVQAKFLEAVNAVAVREAAPVSTKAPRRVSVHYASTYPVCKSCSYYFLSQVRRFKERPSLYSREGPSVRMQACILAGMRPDAVGSGILSRCASRSIVPDCSLFGDKCAVCEMTENAEAMEMVKGAGPVVYLPALQAPFQVTLAQ